MKNIYLGFLLLTIILIPSTSKAVFFDESVLKSVVRIQVFDNVSKQTVTQGTGINIGTEFLTNYHVIELAVNNPTRYTVYACVTKKINSDPDCILNLSTTPVSIDLSPIGNSKFDKRADLAILYLRAINHNGTWKSYINVSLSDWQLNTVNIAEYTKSYQDFTVGDPIYSVGYPDYGGGKTIESSGVVKKLWKDQQSGETWILNNIDISHGNSGGPVFNSVGKLVGVTVACLKASINSDECKSNNGLFIPLPTLNKWYMNITDSHISTFNGYSTYSSNNGISDDVMKTAMCSYPLRQNAYYDKTKNGCSCKIGFSENSNKDCIDSSGYVDNTLRYGQKIDLNKENNSGVILNQTVAPSSKGGNGGGVSNNTAVVSPIIPQSKGGASGVDNLSVVSKNEWKNNTGSIVATSQTNLNSATSSDFKIEDKSTSSKKNNICPDGSMHIPDKNVCHYPGLFSRGWSWLTGLFGFEKNN